MRAILAGSVMAASLTGGAATAYAQEYQFGWNTGSLPNSDLIAAHVVRKPAFIGDPAERDQAIGKAEPALNADYCSKSGSQFVVDPGLVVFDKGFGEWLVGGVCR